MPLFILKTDLVNMNVDAIVNDSNVKLKMVEGVGRAIFHAAGDLELTEACKKIGYCAPGSAVETEPFNLTNAKIIIHAVAPIYNNGKHNEEKLLRSAYRKSLEIASSHNFTKIAFPLLGAEFNWPREICYQIACSELKKFLVENPNVTIYLCMFKNIPDVIDDNLHEALTNYSTSHFTYQNQQKDFAIQKKDFIKVFGKRIKEIPVNTFLYKANLNLEAYNEVLNNPEFAMSKSFAIGICIALEMTLDEMKIALLQLGYEFRNDRLFDLIILYLVQQKIYDIYTINNALFSYNFDLLGCSK